VKWTEDTWRDKKGDNKVTELSEVSDMKVRVISTSENFIQRLTDAVRT